LCFELKEKNVQGLTPLYSAAKYRRHQMVKMLMQNGARVDMILNSGRTVLHDCAGRKDWNAMKNILDASQNKDIINGTAIAHTHTHTHTHTLCAVDA
jgi:ankyrin repeat protein